MPIAMQDIFNKALALLDNYTEDGVVVSQDEVIDMQIKSILFADMAQKELYALGRMEKQFSFSQKPTPNLLGNISNFEQVDYIGTDQVYPEQNGVVGAKAYYFESTGVGVCYIEEFNGTVWNVINTINTALTDAYLPYKGLITPSNTNYQIRMRFSGTTFYRHVNRCLYPYPFTLAQIPPYRPWVEVPLPSDFMDLSQIVAEYPDRQYSLDTNFKWEEPNHLYINYYFDSNYRLTYKPIPLTISAVTDILQCNDIVGQAIVYYVAGKLAPYENQNLVNFFEGKYTELKLQAQSPTPLTWEKVQSVYTLNGAW
jgi:hypothetical protein